MASPQPETLVDLFLHSTRTHAARPLFGEKKHHGPWTWMTYGAFGQLVDEARGGLARLGVGPGDRVAIVSNNRHEWAVGAYATYTLGAAYVPMYEAQHDKEWHFILHDCGAKVVFAATDAIASKLAALQEHLPQLQHVVRLAGPEEASDTLAALCRQGAQTPAPVAHSKPHDMAGLIYTSGTTGNPKGVMLTHANLARNVGSILQVFPISPEDRSLSFLPWAHAFGQTVELHALFSVGASLAIAESAARLADNLPEVQPTLLMAVPHVFQRLYDNLNKRMASEPAWKRKLLARALGVARERLRKREKGQRGLLLDVQYALFDKMMFSQVRRRFGGRLKYAFSGGAAISREVAEFIDAIGIEVYEGYGLTETSPIATANTLGHRKMGSVGRPIPGVRVEIDKSQTGDPVQGEIIVYGHNVMKGYYQLPEEDAKVFTSDGGFRTGDMGYVDADGYLWITGRIKEQYKLANGKYVVPVPIEQSLLLSPFIANVMLHGQNKPFNLCILVPDWEMLLQWAKEQGLDTHDRAALLKRPEVRALYQEQMRHHTREVKGYETPHGFLLVEEDFTVANDMLTPSLKVKRRNVLKRYGEALEALFQEMETRGAHRAS